MSSDTWRSGRLFLLKFPDLLKVCVVSCKFPLRVEKRKPLYILRVVRSDFNHQVTEDAISFDSNRNEQIAIRKTLKHT